MPNNFNFTETEYVPNSYDFNFSIPLPIYNILSGINKNFTGIWADPTAGVDIGKIYVSTNGEGASFFIIDSEKKALYDVYTINYEGSFGESLDQENIVDINVNSAV